MLASSLFRLRRFGNDPARLMQFTVKNGSKMDAETMNVAVQVPACLPSCPHHTSPVSSLSVWVPPPPSPPPTPAHGERTAMPCILCLLWWKLIALPPSLCGYAPLLQYFSQLTFRCDGTTATFPTSRGECGADYKAHMERVVTPFLMHVLCQPPELRTIDGMKALLARSFLDHSDLVVHHKFAAEGHSAVMSKGDWLKLCARGLVRALGPTFGCTTPHGACKYEREDGRAIGTRPFVDAMEQG